MRSRSRGIFTVNKRPFKDLFHFRDRNGRRAVDLKASPWMKHIRLLRLYKTAVQVV